MRSNYTPRENPTRRRKRKLRKRVFLIPIFAIFLFVIWHFVSLYNTANDVIDKSFADDGRDKSDLREETVDPGEDNVSILIIGVDSSEKREAYGTPRSDTLILATLNKKEKSVKLVSIPRDSLVYIPEVGYETKINHAHAYGGAKATIETVENLLEIPVDYYVKLNFEAFIDVVDTINGVTVEVPFEMYEQDSHDTKGAIHLLPGEQVLNGEEALAFARTRKYDNDIERGKRQQEILKAVIKKTISLNSFFKIDNVLEAVGENMTTNMTFNEIKSLSSYGTAMKNIDIETFSLEGHDYQPGNTYYYQLDEFKLSETKEMLKNHLGL
ncbi:LCP family protein [Ornithinibacillus sp. 179-J 7C1 HS]|uniref:LCP family protein n=1 Tax=Ornithinibacillus sp. 179-J 7C1 HS TaxID=3142384 RepID=UPI0039A10527